MLRHAANGLATQDTQITVEQHRCRCIFCASLDTSCLLLLLPGTPPFPLLLLVLPPPLLLSPPLLPLLPPPQMLPPLLLLPPPLLLLLPPLLLGLAPTMRHSHSQDGEQVISCVGHLGPP
jgi:hypothetical protein